MKIVRGRLKSYGKVAEFVSIKGKIRTMIERNKGDVFQFVVDDGKGVKSVMEFGPENINPELVGKKVAIVDRTFFAEFNPDGTIDVVTETNESLPRQQTVDQWNKLRKMTKGIDIGDRVSDMNKQGANIQYIHNPVDTGIESYEDFEKHNKKFIPGWNLKHLTSPFSGEGKKI